MNKQALTNWVNSRWNQFQHLLKTRSTNKRRTGCAAELNLPMMLCSGWIIGFEGCYRKRGRAGVEAGMRWAVCGLEMTPAAADFNKQWMCWRSRGFSSRLTPLA